MGLVNFVKVALDGARAPFNLLFLTLDGQTAIHARMSLDTTGTPIDPATKQGVAGVVTALGTPAQTADVAATTAAVNALASTIAGQRVESLWTDDTGAYFVRVDKGGTITWNDLSGNAVSAPGVGARPAAGATVLLSRSSFVASAAATGYSVGDYLDHFVTTDPASGAVLGNFWVNLTTGAKLASAPASGNIAPISPLPTGAATAALQSSSVTALQQLHTDLAAPTPAGTNVIGRVGLQTAGADNAVGNGAFTIAAGSAGTDFSFNKPALPNVGAAFAAAGPYSGFTLIGTINPDPARAYIEFCNSSTGQIVLVLDDGTAGAGSPPVNATPRPLQGAGAAGGAGDSWSSTTFKGRIQVYGPAGTSPQVNVTRH